MFTVEAETISIRAVVSTTFTSRESSPSSSAHKSEGEILTKSNVKNFRFRKLCGVASCSISEQQPQVKIEICVALIKMLLLELEKPCKLLFKNKGWDVTNPDLIDKSGREDSDIAAGGRGEVQLPYC
ncbi:Uncharacterized protein Rs2_25008 [Raphanus sativus]|nr:Uncharacterized protein Rs2_25008 [Raphanus sativus]